MEEDPRPQKDAFIYAASFTYEAMEPHNITVPRAHFWCVFAVDLSWGFLAHMWVCTQLRAWDLASQLQDRGQGWSPLLDMGAGRLYIRRRILARKTQRPHIVDPREAITLQQSVLWTYSI